LKTALISGISGQDGAYLTKLLLGKGYNVVGITRNLQSLNQINLKYLDVFDKIKFIELSDMNTSNLIPILEQTQPHEIYNLAAQSSVGLSFQEPYKTINYNIFSVLNWLEAIKSTNPLIKFYQASSSEMFGNIDSSKLPLRESMIFRPASPYGVSKAAAHWLTVNYREANNLFCACGILFNHESVLRGDNYVVKKIINHAVKVSMDLCDTTLQLGNTFVQRDWGYAPKFVEAMWLIMQHNKSEDFLICSGNVMSLANLLDIVFDKLDLDKEKHVSIDASLFRPKELEVIYGDNKKAKNILGWDYDLSNEALIDNLINDERNFIQWKLTNNIALA